MTGTIHLEQAPEVIDASAWGETVELVRGREQSLLARLRPIVERESVLLDLGAVERIDAAGLAALIALYREACLAGHGFAVMHPRRHVREVLSLVGLDRVLLAGEAAMPAEQPFLSRLQQTAA